MKEQLIEFDTATLAKDKGFNISTEHFFQYNEKTFGVKSKTGGPTYYADGCSQCSQPTQSLLQKWLREKHNIDVQPYLIEIVSNDKELKQTAKEREYTYRIYSTGITQYVENKDFVWSYEEALEKGLEEALKLI